MNELQKIEFDFNDEKLVNLTTMYAKAVEAGKADGKSNPSEWSKNTGKTFIAKLAKSLNTEKLSIYISKRGKNGGTWAHWQIAAAYATYLDEELHMHFNATIRAMELGDPKIVDRLLRNASDDDKRRMLSKITRRIFTDRIQAAGVDDPMVYGWLTNIITKGILGAKVEVVMEQRGLVPKKDNLRDNLSHTELVRMTLAESMAADAIEQGTDAGEACRKAAEVVGRTKQ